jgi:hypothetical protein
MKLLRKISTRLRKIRTQKKYNEMLLLDTLDQRFSSIYDHNLWSSKESKSGSGSELEYTRPVIDWLIKTISLYKIKTCVDAPCGDFNWMRLVLKDVNVKYIGLDIVDELVRANKLNYSDQHTNFFCNNICKDQIPNCDLLIVRDCLFHLSLQDINKFLNNIAHTDYKYLATTSHITDQKHSNTDIISGDFREINLFLEPFNFSEDAVIDQVIETKKTDKNGRKIILLRKEDVPENLNNSRFPK